MLIGAELSRGSILVRNGKIVRVARRISSATDEKMSVRHLVALPGLVDAHVHLRDMDLSYKEDFISGTSAAAAGGVTTVLDMPNTKPPTDSARRLLEKMDRARDRVLVNVGFHAAAVSDEQSIERLGKAGAFSLKLYLPKPISPLTVEDDAVVTRIMKGALRHRLPITIHAEDKGTIEKAPKREPKSFSDLADNRSPRAETLAVSRMLRLQRQVRTPLHFCHLSLYSSLGMIRNAPAKNVSTEVTPHHMLLSKKWLAKRKWKAWMVPPLRNEANRGKLLNATAEDQVTIIASDHAPHTLKEKRSLPLSLPGVPGLETTLPLLLTLVKKGKFALSRVQELTSANPARVFGLSTKGQLRNGFDGDIVLVDLKKKSKITPEAFHSKAKYSPFEGFRTEGTVHTTIVGGRVAFSEGQIVAKPGTGMVLHN